MQVKELPELFRNAVPVLQELEQAGFEAYFVGGSVRDLLLKRPVHDIDIATNAYPEEIKKIFPKTIDTGIKHGTVTVLAAESTFEITTFRTESTYQDFRRPDHVTFVQDLTEDLKRRDFTINAFAMTKTGEIIDKFDGLTDLKQHVVRAVGDPKERFHEDALRMMRAVRFVSQLDFELETRTRQAISDNNYLLEKIAVERIREEFVKLGLGPGSRQGIKEFLATDLQKYVPGLAAKKSLLQNYLSLEFLPATEELFWAVIVVLIQLTNSEIKPFLRKWKNSNQIIKQVAEIVEFFDEIGDQTVTNQELYHVNLEIITSTVDLSHILGVPLNGVVLIDRYRNLPINENKELAINGKYLLENFEIASGPRVGQLLQEVTEAVLNGEVQNDVENITKYILKVI